MDNPQEKVFAILNALKVEYQLINHPAAFTVEDMDKLNLNQYGNGCKNLFLRDDKGKRHFLVVLDKDKKADLASIQEQLGCTRLGFASEERLFKYLHLHKGEVTPLGIINDHDASVEVVLDNDLVGKKKLGVHPNDNTATVWISFDALQKIIEQNGNIIHIVTI
ncbi:MAG: prolyl-tRNA synthetase associated domain-containing protein [Firmicutes bacterium HGW-Firmicutes-15]|nr:MAG: prolyl-tRNA synthetase associated domain-containing protein [Firmicutes bacterium HGW-Firmicutes-15]